MSGALDGKTIALAEGRQLEELAALLEKEGALTLRCPMLSIINAPDSGPVLAWLRDLIDGKFDDVILMTGEGWRRLLVFAEGEGLREQAIAALGRTRTIVRGPKPVQALREVGLAPALIAPAPTTEGVMAALEHQPLAGRTIGLTLYGAENPTLEQFLRERGATVRTVKPYIYAPASHTDCVADLIGQLAEGRVDVIVFTSSPQVDRLFEVAVERRLEDRLKAGFQRTRVAAVGPVVAGRLHERGVRVDICPEQGFVMKNLVQLIKRAMGS